MFHQNVHAVKHTTRSVATQSQNKSKYFRDPKDLREKSVFCQPSCCIAKGTMDELRESGIIYISAVRYANALNQLILTITFYGISFVSFLLR